MIDLLDGVTVVPEPSEERFNQRQRVDYRNQLEDCLKWPLTFGKGPKMAEAGLPGGAAFGRSSSVKTRRWLRGMPNRW
jgi:hypothetical protein